MWVSVRRQILPVSASVFQEGILFQKSLVFTQCKSSEEEIVLRGPFLKEIIFQDKRNRFAEFTGSYRERSSVRGLISPHPSLIIPPVPTPDGAPFYGEFGSGSLNKATWQPSPYILQKADVSLPHF